MKRSWIYLVLLCFYACNDRGTGTVKVILHYKPFFQEEILLERLSHDEKTVIIDSALLQPGKDVYTLNLPSEEQHTYRLRIRNNPGRLFFINDGKQVDIFIQGRNLEAYHFTEGTLNDDLRDFMQGQIALGERIRENYALLDSFRKNAFPPSRIDSVSRIYDSTRFLSRDRDLAKSAATRSPGVFIFLHNRIDFGRDFKGLEKYIESAIQRFKYHNEVMSLATATLQYISIQTEELNIGDNAPDLVMGDRNGTPFSLQTLRGKYVWVDFWASWCPQCLPYFDLKNRLKQRFGESRLETVSIALESEKEPWEQALYMYNGGGIQLRDEKAWRGKAAYAFKIDSIPFNFLISPQGKIVAKALKPDSVITVVSRFLN